MRKKWGSQQKLSMNEIAKGDVSPSRVSTQERKFRSPKTLDPFSKARESEEKNRDIFSRDNKSRKDNHNKVLSEWDQFGGDSGQKLENKKEDLRIPSGAGIKPQKVTQEQIIDDEDYQEIDYDQFEKTLKNKKKLEEKEQDILRRNKDTTTSIKNEERSKMIFDRLQNLLNDFGDELDHDNNTIREETSEMEYEKGETGKASPSGTIFKPLGGSRNYSNRYLREEF